MKNSKILTILLITGYLILATASIASAAGIVPCGECAAWDKGVCTKINECTICHLFVGINSIINFLLKNIAFPLGVVAILYGGFMIMTSGGSEERVKKGKTALEFAVYGIILAFAGWLIVGTILSSLVTDTLVWPFSREWNTIPSCPVAK